MTHIKTAMWCIPGTKFTVSSPRGSNTSSRALRARYRGPHNAPDELKVQGNYIIEYIEPPKAKDDPFKYTFLRNGNDRIVLEFESTQAAERAIQAATGLKIG